MVKAGDDTNCDNLAALCAVAGVAVVGISAANSAAGNFLPLSWNLRSRWRKLYRRAAATLRCAIRVLSKLRETRALLIPLAKDAGTRFVGGSLSVGWREGAGVHGQHGRVVLVVGASVYTPFRT